MKFSEHWLRTLVDPPLDSEALAHALTMAGLEVEDARAAAPPFTQRRRRQGARASSRIPNAERLTRLHAWTPGSGDAAVDRLRRAQCRRRA